MIGRDRRARKRVANKLRGYFDFILDTHDSHELS